MSNRVPKLALTRRRAAIIAPSMVAAAGLVGVGVFTPLPADAQPYSKFRPVSYTDSGGNTVSCTLIQRIDKDYTTFGETEISGPDSSCFLATVCHSATWTDPFNNPDDSAQSCSWQEHSVWYAPVNASKPFRLQSSVHFEDCIANCNQSFTFTK